MEERQSPLYRMQAEMCKALAHPARLEIIDLIADKELAVSQLLEVMNLAKANLSQHLGVLRRAGILADRREGVKVYYPLSHPQLAEACRLVRETLVRQLFQAGELARKSGLRRTMP